MRFSRSLSTVLFALCCVNIALGRHAFDRRQETTSASISSRTATSRATNTQDGTSARSSSTSLSSTAHSSSVTGGRSSERSGSSTATIATSASPAAATTSATSAMTTSISPSATQALPPSVTAQPEGLPIKPRITPAIGVAGALLILAGLALGLVGIRYQWLYTFLSTALLASLGVTVLIMYVMHPPVNDGVQGAYMAAAVVTGLILGSIAIVFTSITDSLACALGGFCFAMWLMVLVPGGLIKSPTGSSVMIAAFTLASFSAWFIRIVRHYTLIINTAIAGGTVTVLGIDCFSRVGLKEFWIYIWHLNNHEFPLNTVTYPVTRGLKEEIAAMVILAVFGILSQLKIWELVKNKRGRQYVDTQTWNDSRERLEEEVGREVGERHQRELALWEITYGERRRADLRNSSGTGSSSVESLPKNSADAHAVELHNLHGESSSSSKSDFRPMVTARVASEDRQPPATIDLRQPLLGPGASPKSVLEVQPPLAQDCRCPSTNERDAGIHIAGLAQVAASSDPPAPSLSVPAEAQDDHTTRSDDPIALQDTKISPKDDNQSTYTDATVKDNGGADANALLLKRRSRLPTHSTESADQAGARSLLPKSEKRWTLHSNHSILGLPFDEDDGEIVDRSKLAREHLPQEPIEGNLPVDHVKRTSKSPELKTADKQLEWETNDGETRSPVVRGLSNDLSESAVKHRTSEWASQLVDAEKGGLRSSENLVDPAYAQEQARSLDLEDLQRGSNEADGASQGRNLYHQSYRGIGSGTTAVPIHAFPSNALPSSTKRRDDRPRVTTQGLRNSSAPLPSQAVVQSPLEGSPTHRRNVSSPYISPASNNLMDQRTRRLQRAPASTSFHMLASDANHGTASPSDTASVRHLNDHNNATTPPNGRRRTLDENNNDDEMTLTERKASLQLRRSQDQQLQSPISPILTTPTFPHQQPLNQTTRKAHALTQWRQDLQADTVARNQQAALVDESTAARQQMLTERRYAEWQAQRVSYERAQSQQFVDHAMRSGQLDGVHREALRRMQAKANRKVSG